MCTGQKWGTHRTTKLVVFCTVPVLNRPLLGVNDIDPYLESSHGKFQAPSLTPQAHWRAQLGRTHSLHPIGLQANQFYPFARNEPMIAFWDQKKAQFGIKSANQPHLKKHSAMRSWQPELPQGPSVGSPWPQPESRRSSTYSLMVRDFAAWSDHPSLPSSFNLHNHPQSPVLIHHRFNPRSRVAMSVGVDSPYLGIFPHIEDFLSRTFTSGVSFICFLELQSGQAI